MKTIWNLLENEPFFPLLENNGYIEVPVENNECDILICGLEHIDYVGVIADPKESFFIIALNNPNEERYLVPNNYHAWIDRKKLECLPDMLESYKNIIEEKKNYREMHNMLDKFIVDNSVHNANLEGIKLSMRESTQEIEKIFEERVEEMRSIHRDTIVAHEQLTTLKEKIIPEEFNELEESWNTTQSILSRTDDVIKAMFEFVTILQCEDRITQMIDGISKIMKSDVDDAAKNGCTVAFNKEIGLKERLVPFYTIQEQRDYANGQDDALQGRTCKPDAVDIYQFTIF